MCNIQCQNQKKLSLAEKNSSNELFSNYFSKTNAFTKFLQTNLIEDTLK